MKNIAVLFSLIFLFSCSQKQADSASADTNANTASNTPAAVNTNQLSLESSNVQADLPQTTIKWDRATHDFGNIQEGDVVKTVFTITNTGDNPLVINNAKGSCGCTVPKVEKNVPIAPGESTDIEVQFSSKGRPGQNSKNVDLFGNFETPARATITASVEKAAGSPAAATGTPAVDPHAGHNH